MESVPTTSETTTNPDERRYVGIWRGPKGWSCEAAYVRDGKLVKTAQIREPGEKILAMEALKLALADIVLDRSLKVR